MTVGTTSSAVGEAGFASSVNRRVIDVHHHALPRPYLDAMHSLGHDASIPGVAFPEWSAEASAETMDRNGIDSAVLSITAPGLGAARGQRGIQIASRVNDALAELRRAFPGRFGALAVLPVLSGTDAAIAEAQRAIDDLGLDGVGLYTNVDGIYLGDSRFDALMEFLDERRVPSLMHPVAPKQPIETVGLPASVLEFPFDTTRAIANLLFTGTLEKYRNLTLICTHAGGTLPILAHRLTFASTIDPTQKDRQPKDIHGLIRRLYFDVTMSANSVQLAALTSLVPPEHILFGSDYPFMPASHTTENLRGLAGFAGLSDDERTLAAHANAERLFPALKKESA